MALATSQSDWRHAVNCPPFALKPEIYPVLRHRCSAWPPLFEADHVAGLAGGKDCWRSSNAGMNLITTMSAEAAPKVPSAECKKDECTG
jgi:hypothetical protein